jgi:hypothetical protein
MKTFFARRIKRGLSAGENHEDENLDGGVGGFGWSMHQCDGAGHG